MAEECIAYDGPIVTRAQAKAASLRRYFTGKPCKRGHIAQRLTSKSMCIECTKMLCDEYQARYPERVKASKARYIDANRQEHYARVSRWESRNRDKKRSYSRNWFARRKATNDKHSGAEIEGLFKRQKGKCANCSVSIKLGYEVDHIHPLSKGGSNAIRNLQLLCMPCNRKKSNKHPIDWAQQNGRLL